MPRFMIALVCVATFSSCASASSRIANGRASLARAVPRNVTWQYERMLDINCDDRADAVFTASDEQRFYVGVVLGPVRATSYSSVVSFARSGDSQESLCGPVESLLPERLTSAMADGADEEPLGYEAGSNCSGLRLVSGECDAFHLYWNHVSNALDRWRL
jgi:hypothetical protein